MIKQEIAGGKRHLYQITLSSGQFARIIFAAQDSHFAIALFAPHNRKIVDLNSRQFRQTPISFITDFPGVYNLEIRSLEADEDAA